MVLQNKSIFRENQKRLEKIRRQNRGDLERETVWPLFCRILLIGSTTLGLTLCGSSFFGYSGKTVVAILFWLKRVKISRIYPSKVNSKL